MRDFKEAMFSLTVTLKVGFLLKTFWGFTEITKVFRRLAAFVIQVAFQASFVFVGLAALGATERLEHDDLN